MNHFVSIQLNKNDTLPLYQQLGNSLFQLIEKSILKPNTKLPPIRKLSKELHINSVTVINAYKYLENKGVVYSQVGSGTYVAPLPLEEVPTPILDDELQKPKQNQIMLSKNCINFATMSPSTELFPVNDFKTIFNQVLDRDKGDAFTYQESQGFFPLRDAICNYLTYYGIQSEAKKIQIISGAQQGIDILSKAMLQYGDVLFVEQPTYHGAIAAFHSRGAKIIEIPLDSDGMNMELLENYLKLFHPKFIYMMTYFQNPTGVSYSIEKKRLLLELAEQYDTYIIEDDYLSDLNFSDKPTIPLKALDHRNRVVYIKSFSKILMPGLRLGFLVLPNRILNHVLSAKHTTDISTSGFIQRVFAEYLNSGLWKSHTKKISQVYRTRYECLNHKIQSKLSDLVEYVPPQGGLSVWLTFKDEISIEKLSDLLLFHNVIISPGSLFFLKNDSYNSIRLSFASLDEKEIIKGIDTMSSVLEQMLDSTNNTISPLL